MTIRVSLRHCVLYVASGGITVRIHNVSKNRYTCTTGCWGDVFHEKEYLAGFLSLELWRESSGSLEWVVAFGPLLPIRRAWHALTNHAK